MAKIYVVGFTDDIRYWMKNADHPLVTIVRSKQMADKLCEGTVWIPRELNIQSLQKVERLVERNMVARANEAKRMEQMK